MAPERRVPWGMMQRCVPTLPPRLEEAGDWWGGGIFLDAKPPKLLLGGPRLESSSKTPAVGLEHCLPFSDVK